jgi:hypothetical protein
MGFVRRFLGAVKPDAVRFPAWVIEPERPDARVRVAGERRYQSALVRLAGGVDGDAPRRTDQLAALIPEPENPYDEHAICIRIGGRRVGYLDQDDARSYGPAVRLAAAHGRLLAVEARLSSARNGGGERSPSIAVTLRLGTPGETLLAVRDAADDPVTVRTDHPWPGATVMFTGSGAFTMAGVPIDRPTAAALAMRAGLTVTGRLSRKVALLVAGDRPTPSRARENAIERGIPILPEAEFWRKLGVAVDHIDVRVPAASAQSRRPRVASSRVSLPKGEPAG